MVRKALFGLGLILVIISGISLARLLILGVQYSTYTLGQASGYLFFLVLGAYIVQKNRGNR